MFGGALRRQIQGAASKHAIEGTASLEESEIGNRVWTMMWCVRMKTKRRDRSIVPLPAEFPENFGRVVLAPG